MRGPVVLVLCCALCACKDKPDPVDVPFGGIEVRPGARRAASDQGARPSGASPDRAANPARAASPGEILTASATASADEGGGPSPAVAAVTACCNALRAALNKAADPAAKANDRGALGVCADQRQQVIDHKVNQAQALAAVRASLAGDAPGACH